MAGQVDKEKKWELVQIKAFKSWVNDTLEKRKLPHVENLQTDFQDGVRLNQFLEGVTSKKVGKFDLKPSQKIQKIQNLSIGLKFVEESLGVKLVGIGPEDLFDGNLKLILGLLWSLFRKLRLAVFQEEGKSSEDGLLNWVRQMTAGYKGVNINTFKDSFNDGLAFSALIHKFNSDLLNYDSLNGEDRENNLDKAFDIAEKSLGIPRLLDPSDLIAGPVDERSVILYVSLYFHAFVANDEMRKIEAQKSEITDKVANLQAQLDEANEEKESLRRRQKQLEDEKAALQAALDEKDGQLSEANEKLKLLEAELDYMRQRAIADAEAIALLEQKIAVLNALLEEEQVENKELSEARARLRAELEELKNRGKQLAGEKESLDELRKRLITDNEAKDAALRDLDTRRNALQNEIDELRKKVNAEIAKRNAAAKQILELRKELENIKRKQIVQGKARGGLDVLRRNLEEHLEDMYRWRELHELDLADEKRTFDLDKVIADIQNKTFEQQIEYLNDILSEENKSLLRIIRLKDSKFKLKDIQVKAGWLSMKGRKDWKKRWFSLRGQSLFYYENETAERCEGYVDLTKGCEVVRQKAVKEDDSAKKQWPLKITVGDRKLFVRAATKKERHSWYLFLASKIAHINYLKACESAGSRPDTRIISLFVSESVPNLYLEHRPIPEEAAVALSKTLPAHDETETLSLSNSSLNDAALKHIAEVLEKLSVKSLVLSHNKITGTGAKDLARGISSSASLTELDLSHNEIDDGGVAAIAEAIGAKPAVTSVNLSNNKIGAAGVQAFVDAISSSDKSFPQVNLANNNLDDSAVASLAKLISSNTTITHLNLAGNKIGDAGAAQLAEALRGNHNILYVDLSNNHIGNAGAVAIQNLLKHNQTIIEFNLSANKFLGGSETSGIILEGFNFPNLLLNRVNPTSF